MREAHVHIAALGQSLSMPSLADCSSLAECLERIRAAAADVRAGEWVRVIGARIESWPERRWPTITELDRAAPHRPCAILSFDHHAAAANAAAMRAGNVRAGEPVPPQGVVCVDARGDATGLLLEHAAYRVWQAAPEPTRSQAREHVLAGLNSLATLGFTEAHDLHSQDWLGPVLTEIERSGELPLDRVLLYPGVSRLAEAHRTRARWENPRVRLAGGKLFADGTLNSLTAFMLTHYREPLDGLPLGKAMATPEELDSALRLCEELGLQLAVHAIGDAAVRMVLDACEARGAPAQPLRIEHCELIDAADVPRFAKLGVICSVQPCHMLADGEVLRRQLPHRLDRVLPLRELLDSGAEVWFGSDAPIVRADPADSLRAATVHPLAPGQSITDAQARACFGHR